VKKVQEAAALLAKEGSAAFPRFRGKDSPFIFGGTYVWIHDLEGTMLLHPIKFRMEGKRLLNLKDSNGKLFFVEMNRVAREKKHGWVSYMWPRPGETKPTPKISYVQLAKMNGKDVVIGCGLYEPTAEEIAKLTAE
jgi:signal transduction histidine kinase